ncbi:hypothetical protein SDRG_05296 [Saprolegnia diclina VS20]|uniref:N-acetyltransferase domain-containing protein n=1 Tax=Saprolegnia diclina (strain VS20) TaxID=1156394 RepID=T0QGI0_SAPDV|nr:hypothetical protein SDRG_05296 [Saprolegnia diclina VS20]EQC37069.1 hypothetical protein SDRG_05296 [Saprolegnia diclina VS20]|eukprot:XP_008609231.1 hypothetical protein SDRG_05296 [Saprolegnia diclina VS20]
MGLPSLPTSARLTYLAPAPHLDDAVRAIFAQEANMQYIPFLCNLSDDAWASRRSSHRSMMANCEGAFLDVVETSSGAVVGTTGFRVMDVAKGEGEWGVILSETAQGKGYCREMHDACMVWAKSIGLHRITAATWVSNARMNQLLLQYGWTFLETDVNELGTWNEYEYVLH